MVINTLQKSCMFYICCNLIVNAFSGEGGDTVPLNGAVPDSYCLSYHDIPVTSKAKALSLRELVSCLK